MMLRRRMGSSGHFGVSKINARAQKRTHFQPRGAIGETAKQTHLADQENKQRNSLILLWISPLR